MWNDLCYALRGLGRNPALAVVAILTLAFGIGVNTTMFSIADAYFLRPLPGKNPSQLVRLTSHTPQGEDDYFSYPDYRDISAECSAFSGILAYSGGAGFLSIPESSRLIVVEHVSRRLYGVVAYLVNGRTREIGLRVALGAQRSEVLRLVVGQGLKLAALGAGLGVFLALGATRFMASLLHGVSPDDPVALAISCVLAVTVALAASYVPARRAMRVDPASALRAE